MKKLPLKNQSFRYLQQGFAEWLDILGYAPSTVYGLPLHVRELLNYLENKGVSTITQLEVEHIVNYYQKLRIRSNTKNSGALSNSHLNKHIQAIRKFVDYLRQVGRIEIPDLPLKNEELEKGQVNYLTEQEIKKLFNATYQPYPHPFRKQDFVEALKSRDRAMLAVFYGCGARRNEGCQLDLADINFDKAILHIKKGKRYKERLVPIGKQALYYLQEWVYDYRGRYKRNKTDALFISERGSRITGQSLLIRLKTLQELTENEVLQNKEIGLHTLRHSIATHLLENGMNIESISRFLGHSSLASTQIYTHLLQENVEYQ